MSFASGHDIMEIIQKVVKSLWQAFLSVRLPQSFPIMTYSEAISNYGCDKPDLRIPFPHFASIGHMVPADLTSMITTLNKSVIEAMVVPLQCTPHDSKSLLAAFFGTTEGQSFLDNPDGAPGIFIYDSKRPLSGLSAFGFEAAEWLEQENDLADGYVIVLQARPGLAHSGGSTMLGNLRTALFWAAVRAGHLPAPSWSLFRPIWITDFPLFSPINPDEPGQGGNAGLASTHHPFTSPKTPEDVDLLMHDPRSVTGNHFDLVINGEEIGGGSQRIHHAAMQEYIFRKILKMDESRISEFRHLLEALRAGCPPHAGMALGFDRLVAMMVSSIQERTLGVRDVVAFPKTGKGDDPMMMSPGRLTDDVLETYHLQLAS